MTERTVLEIVAATIDEYIDFCDYEPQYNEAGACIDSAAASAVVAALRSARLLLPEGATEEIIHGHESDRGMSVFCQPSAATHTRTVWRGPWLPVKEETK